MAVKNLPVEVNSFVKGLVTEASPLTFPENASLDEANFVLLRDGSRRRRLGLAQQGVGRNLGTIGLNGKSTTAYQWEEAGGTVGTSFIVCQVGATLLFYSINEQEQFPEYHSSIDVSTLVVVSSEPPKMDMIAIDGILVVAFGNPEVLSITYDSVTDTFEPSTFRIKVRDLFGMQAPYTREEFTFNNGKTFPAATFEDLLDDSSSQIRPHLLSKEHLYNLRNQSWGRLRDGLIQSTEEEGLDLSKDPIDIFRAAMFKKNFVTYAGSGRDIFPSNSDLVATGLIDYAEKKGAPERFSAQELGDTPRASSSAPKGYFIIDALRRGFSRGQNVLKMLGEGLGEYDYGYFDPYLADATPEGARCVAEFAGRVWYAGFSNKVVSGDTRSPKLGSYVMFSQLIKDPSQFANCYQKNDPTYEKEADLLATDGGFIRLDGALNIQRLVNVGNSIMVFASNGVWSISGNTDEGFTAEAYYVKKLSDKGILAPKSVVVVDSSCMFWGEDGIYLVAPTELGGYQSKNISNNTIQKKYEGIPLDQRRDGQGIYDKYDNTVRWVYGVKAVGSESHELVLNLDLNAYSYNLIKPADAFTGVVLAPVTVPPFKAGLEQKEVFVGLDQVFVGTDEVLVGQKSSITTNRETFYFSLLSENRLNVGFTAYTNENFRDWSQTGTDGTDAEAFVITGYGPQGDFQRRKQVPYITNYLLRTEDGFEEQDGDIIPTNQSSCMLQARWEWANSPNGNKWGRSFETYRYNRFYMPADINDRYDTGDEVIVTKNKLRGHGRTLSLKFTTSPSKDCRLLGWSMIVGVSTSV